MMSTTHNPFIIHRSVIKKIEEPVKRAFDKFETVLNREDRHLFFFSVAQKVNPSLTPVEVEKIVNKVYNVEIDVMVDYRVKSSLMYAVPFPNPLDPDQSRAQIVFATSFANIDCEDDDPSTMKLYSDRQEFVHFVKLLHEFSHLLTPSLVESLGEVKVEDVVHQCHELIKTDNYEKAIIIAKTLNTPEKIGSIQGKYDVKLKYQSDVGSELEEILFGGRVLTTDVKCQNPFTRKLELKQRGNIPDYPPVNGNFMQSFIDDAFIAEFLAKDFSTIPIGDFLIPSNNLIFRKGYTEAVDVFLSLLRLRKRKHGLIDEGGVGFEVPEEDGDGPIGSAYGVTLSNEELEMMKLGIKF